MRFLITSDIHVTETSYYRLKATKILINKLSVLGKKLNIDSLVVCGDLFHTSRPCSIDTILMFGKLFKQFENVFLIVGNHDTFERGTTKTSLLDIFSLLNNVTIVYDTFVFRDKYLFVSYYSNFNSTIASGYKFIFSHKDVFEFNRFCDEDFGISVKDYPPNSIVFNGHIHSPQIKEYENGLKYIQTGSPYPISINDSNQNRFCYLLNISSENINFKAIELNIGYFKNNPIKEGVEYELEFPYVKSEKSVADVVKFDVDSIKNLDVDLFSIPEMMSLDSRLSKMSTKIMKSIQKTKISSSVF